MEAFLVQASCTKDQASISTQKLVLQNFSNPVSIKLDAWKQQAEALIIKYDREDYLDYNQIPKQFNSVKDEAISKVSQEFSHWKKQAR